MEKLEFGNAFKYPFTNWKRLFNILWILIPILGVFAVMGYQIRLVNEWVLGKFEGLPKFEFWENLKLGFIIFLKMIPLLLVFIVISTLVNAGQLGRNGVGFAITLIIGVLFLPMLFINLMVKKTLKSSFEFDVLNAVFGNFGDYIVALIKDIVLAVIFAILAIILVGIPAQSFTKNIFMSDFYRRHVK